MANTKRKLQSQDRANRIVESSEELLSLHARSQAIACDSLLTAPTGELALLRYLATPQEDAIQFEGEGE